MGKRKRKSKKRKNLGPNPEPETLTKAPHSFVIRRGKLGKHINELMMNYRQVLEPFTAINLKVKKNNSIRDFVSVAAPLNVTHLMVFTRTAKAAYLRLTRIPHGPTLTYKIVNFCLAKDVRSALRKPLVYSGLFQLSPLLVLNSFTGDELQMKLMTSMWRNVFPSIDVNKIHLNTIRRCVLLNYNPDTQLIDFRHYSIRVRPVGVSRPLKKLFTAKRIPDLGQYKDIHEMMAQNAAFTESEGEAEDENDEKRQITLPQNISSRGNMRNEKSAIRLVELGPRMSLQLIKIEEGLMNGEVLYHSLIKKTKAEVKEQKRVRQQKIHLKLSRKRQQQENVQRKQMNNAKRFKISEDNQSQ